MAGGRGKKWGKRAQRSEPLPAKLQRGAFDEFNGRKTHPKWGTHDGPRPIAEARGDLAPRSFVGERGDSRMVGWQGGSWDDRFLLPWEETLFSNGFHFGCRQPDTPSILQGEGGRKKLTDREGWRCKSRVLYPNLLYLAYTNLKNREHGLMALLWKFQITEALQTGMKYWPLSSERPSGVSNLNGQEQITNQVLLGWIKVWLMCVPWCLLPSRATTGPFLYCETENTQKNTQSINTQFKNLLWNTHTWNQHPSSDGKGTLLPLWKQTYTHSPQ